MNYIANKPIMKTKYIQAHDHIKVISCRNDLISQFVFKFLIILMTSRKVVELSKTMISQIDSLEI